MKNIYSNIEKAKKYLTNNNVVAIPTETVYGLAGNAYSNKAVKKIFSLKKRSLKNPLIVHYCSINDLLLISTGIFFIFIKNIIIVI